MGSVRHFLLAIQFFTRIPVTGALAHWVGYSPAMLRASAAYFPAVGLVVGGLVTALTAALLYGLPTAYAPLVAAALGTAAGVWITGAFHEDGLADVADGLGGSYDRDRALVIMKDSRVGAFGAIAVALALLAKVALLALIGAVSPVWMCAALMGAHLVSRTWPLLVIRLLPHVGDEAGSKSKPLADQITGVSLAVALAWCGAGLVLTVVLTALWRTPGLAGCAGLDCTYAAPYALTVWGSALAASALAFVHLWRLFARRLQGFTGDCLGSVQQLCELAFYLGLALGLGASGS